MASIHTPAALGGPAASAVRVMQDVFGVVEGQTVDRFTLTNSKMSVQVISLGAIITSIRVPDITGKQEDVVMGFDFPEAYLSGDNPYFGATVGRVANRIANSSFMLDGKEYKLFPNGGSYTLHGGRKGWDKALWRASPLQDGVTFTHISADGDEGFPGTVLVHLTYRLTDDDRLTIHIGASSDKPTPINVVNHSYFNLGGHGAGAKDIYVTSLQVRADRFTVTDAFSIPTGELAPVAGTALDLRAPRLLGDVLSKYDLDNNLVIERNSEPFRKLVLAARADHGPSGRTLDVYTDQPGVQVYTSNGLPEEAKPPMIGKGGAKYRRHGAFCLETQNFPDAIHHEGVFPTSVLRPGQWYEHNMIFAFGVRRSPPLVHWQ